MLWWAELGHQDRSRCARRGRSEPVEERASGWSRSSGPRSRTGSISAIRAALRLLLLTAAALLVTLSPAHAQDTGVLQVESNVRGAVV